MSPPSIGTFRSSNRAPSITPSVPAARATARATASSTAPSETGSDAAPNFPSCLWPKETNTKHEGHEDRDAPKGCPDPLPPTNLLFDGSAGYALETLFACMPFWSWLASQETLAPSPRLLKPRIRYSAVVHEGVLATLVRGDEAVAFIVGQPLYRSLGHIWSPPFSLGWEAPPQQKAAPHVEGGALLTIKPASIYRTYFTMSEARIP
jgi:hypothetical protein